MVASSASERLGDSIAAIFVGRERELRVLRGAVEDAVTGRGRLVLIAGEPGIGKTRTAEELAEHASSRGAQVIWGRCYEGEGAPAFWPWVQIVRSCAVPLSTETLRAVLGDAITDLAHLLPSIRAVDAIGSPAAESAEARFRLFDAVARLLEHRARNTPLVLMFDDLHGADRSSLQLLQFVARTLRDVPIVVLACYRDVHLTAGAPLTDTFIEALRHSGTEHLTLTGLDVDEVAHFLEQTAGVAPSPAAAAALHRQTAGNPLFLKEFVQALRNDGRLATLCEPQPTGGWQIPASVRAMIDKRLAPLSATCRALLGIGAVLGREVRHDVLERVCASEGQDTAALDEALHEAAAARVFIPDVDPSRYRFAHALIYETLYEGLRSVDRSRLHRLTGDALAALPGSEDALAELAYHYSAAGPDDAARAVSYAQRAGDRAMEALAYEEAARLYDLALTALTRTSEDDAALCALLLRLGEANKSAGNPTEAKPAFRRAAEIARRMKSPEQLTQAALGFAPALFFAEAEVPDPEQIGLLDEAVAIWGDADNALLARACARLALDLYFWDPDNRKHDLSRRAVAMARRVGEPGALAYVLMCQHQLERGPGTIDQGLSIAEELLQLAARAGDRQMIAQGRAWRCNDLLEAGDVFGFTQELDRFCALASSLRQPIWNWYAHMLCANLATLKGDFDSAVQHATDAFAIGQTILTYAAPIYFHGVMWAIGRLRGGDEDAGVIVRDLAATHPLASVNCTVVSIETALGHEDEARRWLDQIAANNFQDFAHDWIWMSAIAQLAEACTVLGDRPRARVLYDLLLPHAQQWIVWGDGVCYGPVHHYLGLLATTLKRWSAAARHFETALTALTRSGAHALVVRTQVEYAAMLHARGGRGDHTRADELSAVALRTARKLGMSLWADRIASLQRPAAAAKPAQTPRAAVTTAKVKPTTRARIEKNGRRSTACVVRRDGDVWSIVFAKKTHRLKDTRGLQYLAHLFGHPNREFHVNEIATLKNGPMSAKPRGHAQTAADLGDAGELLDTQATRQYQHRLSEVREELAEAETHNDAGRTAQLRAELEFLVAELTSAGRGKRAASHTERARSAVGKRIRDALNQIAEVNPTLGRYLRATVRTGTFCSYTPDPRLRVDCEP